MSTCPECLLYVKQEAKLSQICFMSMNISINHSRSYAIVRFESLGMVSYLHFITTMVISLAICEIFSIKEWRDIEIWVWDRSRLLKMAPFDRQYMTFDWSTIVTVCKHSSVLYCFRVIWH